MVIQVMLFYIATQCLRYNTCSAWFLDIRISTCCAKFLECFILKITVCAIISGFHKSGHI